MYAQFYGFRDLPFRITPDPRLLYRNACYDEAAAALAYGIEDRKGFLSLVGEAGTGKTTLLRHLLDTLPPATRTVLLLHPTVGFDEVLEYILQELGIPTDGGRKLVLLQRLHEFLLEHTRAGGNVALLIDEAQDLDAVVLEELRLLSNLETGREKILQILLAGQPELERKLAQPGLRQLRQRVAMHVRLRPLAIDEVETYVLTRLRAVGGEDDVFTPQALARVAEVSRGIPRVVNVICDACLVTGVALGTRQVTREMVEEAWTDYARLLPSDDEDVVPPPPVALFPTVPPATEPTGVRAEASTHDRNGQAPRPRAADPLAAAPPPAEIVPPDETTVPAGAAPPDEATAPAGAAPPAHATPSPAVVGTRADAPAAPAAAPPAAGAGRSVDHYDFAADRGRRQARTAAPRPPARRIAIALAVATVLGAGIAAYAIATGLLPRPGFVPGALVEAVQARDLRRLAMPTRSPDPAPPGTVPALPPQAPPASRTQDAAARPAERGTRHAGAPAGDEPTAQAAPDAVATTDDAGTPPTAEEARAVVQAFRLAYEDRDVTRLAALFTPDAVENDRRGRDGIAAAYREAFAHIDQVRYTLERPEVTSGDGRVLVRGPFAIRYASPPAGHGEMRGTAAWEIARRDGQARIVAMRWQLAPER